MTSDNNTSSIITIAADIVQSAHYASQQVERVVGGGSAAPALAGVIRAGVGLGLSNAARGLELYGRLHDVAAELLFDRRLGLPSSPVVPTPTHNVLAIKPDRNATFHLVLHNRAPRVVTLSLRVGELVDGQQKPHPRPTVRFNPDAPVVASDGLRRVTVDVSLKDSTITAGSYQFTIDVIEASVPMARHVVFLEVAA